MAVTGINTNAVASIERQLENYIKAIKKNKISLEHSGAVRKTAIQGEETVKKLKEYHQVINESIDQFVTEIYKPFENVLKQVSENYQKNDEEAKAVSQAINGFKKS